ncbi:mucin-2-like [Sycon ciliatum]|uniref:mucin-2-like n=1 Tax=Sycon ciliatum TaxID=27933 RepID=UPI0031F630E9
MYVFTSRRLEATGELLESYHHDTATNLLYLSIRCSSRSSVTATANTASFQESTAAASNAEASSSNSSPIPNYDDVVIPAPRTTTKLSTGTSSATPDTKYEEMCLLPSKITDAAVECSADNDIKCLQDICLANDAGEDSETLPETTSATTPKSTNARTTTTNTTIPVTTPNTDPSVSLTTTSTTTPVFRSEEEAPMASIPAAGQGTVYAEVIFPKKSCNGCDLVNILKTV